MNSINNFSLFNGIVSEAGIYTELMNHHNLYRKLNNMQFDFVMLP